MIGAAASACPPANLPDGRQLINAVLAGLADVVSRLDCGSRRALDHAELEVLLQAVQEALVDQAHLQEVYSPLKVESFNLCHWILTRALEERWVPGIATTNQDTCFAEAVVQRNLAQGHILYLHGRCDVPDTLRTTLREIGPRLPSQTEQVLRSLLLPGSGESRSLFVVGYGGADPDLYFTFDRWLGGEDGNVFADDTALYWLVHGQQDTGELRAHVRSLWQKHGRKGKLILCSGDISAVLRDCARVWHLTQVEDEYKRLRLAPCDRDGIMRSISKWSAPLGAAEKQMVVGWCLVSLGQARQGAALLEQATEKAGHPPQVRGLALMLAGYARRRLGQHKRAGHLLRTAERMFPQAWRYRRAQCLHRREEAETTFERLKLRHLLVSPWGMRGLGKARRMYRSALRRQPDVGSTQYLSWAGSGWLYLNYAQLELRVLLLSLALGKVARLMARRARSRGERWVDEARQEFEKEGDMRGLALARQVEAMLGGDPAGMQRELRLALEYEEFWTRDAIQTGWAHFNLAGARQGTDPCGALKEMREARTCFAEAGVDAEQARAAVGEALLRRGPHVRRSPLWRLRVALTMLSAVMRSGEADQALKEARQQQCEAERAHDEERLVHALYKQAAIRAARYADGSALWKLLLIAEAAFTT